ncbi:MepB family protein [Fulvivirga sediminis]|uniref:MepB family protein n=1 Tax=Fulvivirga sediminis TaxID=2803949 RepID=A0A937JZ79_9BACT|nr:MepB family protein [Fulvivirga sediminis]MBL3657143.1 MepB family protein [Fulvivirga sediminis]
MYPTISFVKSAVYDVLDYKISHYNEELESKDYEACRFKLNGDNIVSRAAKITPKKAGQFVTFWKRNSESIIEPLNQSDDIDFFVINITYRKQRGQFVFPGSVLMNKGIISTESKEGKRAFRVYPVWDTVLNKQAERSQKWQLNYFYEITASTDLEKVRLLYRNQ